jgi:radical SAM/Cys-rich protein
MISFVEKINASLLDLPPQNLSTLQVNLTKLCNQACRHCHVDSGPKRREALSPDSVARVLALLAHESFTTLDLTGGAPELHPQFKEIVATARALGKKIIVRHNLTVSYDPHPVTNEKMLWVQEFLAAHRVEVVSSLPYYREFLTDRQRGQGVFKKSILGLQALNQLGYGKAGTGLVLNLVYNPVGHYLPPEQAALEKEYKSELAAKFGIEFNQLFTITNMPIKRFREDLERAQKYEEYMETLHAAFNPQAAESVMCRSMLSVAWDGTVYDCDFNQMLELPARAGGERVTLENFDVKSFLRRSIVWGDHCYGCTAGSGSSCGGATT